MYLNAEHNFQNEILLSRRKFRCHHCRREGVCAGCAPLQQTSCGQNDNPAGKLYYKIMQKTAVKNTPKWGDEGGEGGGGLFLV